MKRKWWTRNCSITLDNSLNIIHKASGRVVASCGFVAAIVPISIITYSGLEANASQLSTQTVVEMIAPILVGVGEDLSKHTNIGPPQILFGIGGTNTYGGCKDGQGSSIILGSYYCPATNTIILEIFQLGKLRENHGDGAIAYALFHEYAHYIQRIFEIKFTNSIEQELHADCLAGMFLNLSAKKLQLDASDINEIQLTAYSIGGSSHGTGTQRVNAVKFGLENGTDEGCLRSALKSDPSPFISPQGITKPNANVASRRPQNTTQAANTNPKVKGETYLGIYSLWGRTQAKIFKTKTGVDYFKYKTIGVRYIDMQTGIARSSNMYVDCKNKKWSFFPDMPDGIYAIDADNDMLKASGCY
jgi:hypothetical protein